MKSSLSFVLSVFCTYLISVNCWTDPEEKVFLSVYYESKCPDSKNFILKQLVPAMRLLHNHLALRFIPFGKAKSIDLGVSGFECQHGRTECRGNIVQDCVLDHMTSSTDLLKLDYVACEMETEAASRGDFQCVTKAGIPREVVEKCVKSGQGTELQLQSEFLTTIVRPTFIPTVIAEGHFDQDFQDYAQVNFAETLCSLHTLMFTNACLHYHNSLAMHDILSNEPLMLFNNN